MHLQASECHGAIVVHAHLWLNMLVMLCVLCRFFPDYVCWFVSYELCDPSLDQLYEILYDVNFFRPFVIKSYDTHMIYTPLFQLT